MIFEVWLSKEEYDVTVIIDIPNNNPDRALESVISEANRLSTKFNAKVKFIKCLHSGTFKKPYTNRRINK